jgi:hypothetical protein
MVPFAAVVELTIVVGVPLTVGLYGMGGVALLLYDDRGLLGGGRVLAMIAPFIAGVAVIAAALHPKIDLSDDAPQAEAQTAGTDTRDP